MTSDGEIIEVVVSDLGPGPMVRGANALDLDHIARMLPFVDDLPLIHVRLVGGGYEILDGHHRHAVHEQLKRDTMRAVLLELDDLEAFAYAAKVNGSHGAGLDLKARRQNAVYLLKRSDWSDREIARCAVLSPTTVAKLRSQLAPTVQNGQSAKRTGADGVQRPANNEASKAQRDTIAGLLVDGGDANDIARRLGCSVTTVRAVRADLEELAAAENSGAGGSTPAAPDAPGQVPAPDPVQDPHGERATADAPEADDGTGLASHTVEGDAGGAPASPMFSPQVIDAMEWIATLDVAAVIEAGRVPAACFPEGPGQERGIAVLDDFTDWLYRHHKEINP